MSSFPPLVTIHPNYIPIREIDTVGYIYAQRIATKKGLFTVSHVVFGKKDRVLKYQAPGYRLLSSNRPIKQEQIKGRPTYTANTVIVVEIKERVNIKATMINGHLISTHTCGDITCYYLDTSPITDDVFTDIKGIMDGTRFKELPLLINEYLYKPFCEEALKGTQIYL